MEEYLNEYLLGNITYVREYISRGPYTLGEFLEFFIERCEPNNEEIVCFVKSLGY